MAKFLTLKGLTTFYNGFKDKLLTSELLESISNSTAHANSDHAPSNAEENVIAEVKVNGVVVSPISKSVDIEVPTKMSQLSNDSDFITNEEAGNSYVSNEEYTEALREINSKIVDFTSGKLVKEIVSELPSPSEASDSIIYMVPRDTTSENNVYAEYMLIGNSLEKLGDSDINLSDYVKSSDLEEITDDEIDEIFA